jgi:hypothetical protein
MWKHLHVDFCQTHRRPGSILLPNADCAKHHHRLVCISCCRSRHRQNPISMFPYRANSALVQWSLTDIGYYVESRFVFQQDTWHVQLKWVEVLKICEADSAHCGLCTPGSPRSVMKSTVHFCGQLKLCGFGSCGEGVRISFIPRVSDVDATFLFHNYNRNINYCSYAKPGLVKKTQVLLSPRV